MDKECLKTSMLALTEQELTSAREHYAQYLSTARIDQSEPVENDEQAQAETSADLAEAFDEQSHQYADKVAHLKRVDFGPKTVVEEGAAVTIGGRHFAIAVSTAPFTCDGKEVIGISRSAPIFEAIDGLEAGDTTEFRGRTLTIDAVH